MRQRDDLDLGRGAGEAGGSAAGGAGAADVQEGALQADVRGGEGIARHAEAALLRAAAGPRGHDPPSPGPRHARRPRRHRAQAQDDGGTCGFLYHRLVVSGFFGAVVIVGSILPHGHGCFSILHGGPIELFPIPASAPRLV